MADSVSRKFDVAGAFDLRFKMLGMNFEIKTPGAFEIELEAIRSYGSRGFYVG